MRLYFIRHAQSENNLLWEQTGSSKGRSSDPEITTVGYEQAELLAAFLRKKDDEARVNDAVADHGRDVFCFTHLYTSLMVRSVLTASYVARALEMPLHAWPEIHECGGIFKDGEEEGQQQGLPGNPRSYFSRRFPHLIIPESVTEAGWWNRPFEAYEQRALRAQRVVEMLLERHGGTSDRVAIVSHGGFYFELMRVLFDVRSENGWFSMNNTGISRFDFRKSGELAMYYHNRTEHLPAGLVT
jgi:2,3-bisphosphoglycerate-dependent phosphoglycerate mutase